MSCLNKENNYLGKQQRISGIMVSGPTIILFEYAGKQAFDLEIF
jgi:hypothetical protein